MKFKNNRGITLSSLLVTVIVLVAIAGTATYSGINVYRGAKEESFIQELQLVQNAVNTIRSRLENCDETYMNYVFNSTNEIIANVKTSSRITSSNHPLKKSSNSNLYGYRYLNEEALNKIGITSIKQDLIVNFTTGEVYSINGFNNKYTLNDFNMNTVVSDEIVTTTVNKVPIPRGFAYKEGTKDNGLVIVNMKDGNEFVWVPIDSTAQNEQPMYIKEIIETGEVFTGELYNWENWTSGAIVAKMGSSYIEPQINPNQNSTTDQIQYEYNKMATSVELNGGFYVGRYETSWNGSKVASVSNVKPMTTSTTISGSSSNWYTFYNKQKELYPDDDTNITGAVSGMIYGSQWDAIMNWMKNETNTSSGKYIINSVGKGNYSTSVINTGSNQNYKVKNIYDLAGNYYEGTQEAYSTTKRVYRGGAYNLNSDTYPVSNRSTSSSTYTSRIQLYINNIPEIQPVTKIDVESVEITGPTNEIMINQIISLTATVLPNNAADTTLTWTSSNESIATVDEFGRVTGNAEGTATITATSVNDKTATYTIKVKEKITLTYKAGIKEIYTEEVIIGNPGIKQTTSDSALNTLIKNSLDTAVSATDILGYYYDPECTQKVLSNDSFEEDTTIYIDFSFTIASTYYSSGNIVGIQKYNSYNTNLGLVPVAYSSGDFEGLGEYSSCKFSSSSNAQGIGFEWTGTKGSYYMYVAYINNTTGETYKVKYRLIVS